MKSKSPIKENHEGTCRSNEWLSKNIVGVAKFWLNITDFKVFFRKGGDVSTITGELTVLSRDYNWTVPDAFMKCLPKCDEANTACYFTFVYYW